MSSKYKTLKLMTIGMVVGSAVAGASFGIYYLATKDDEKHIDYNFINNDLFNGSGPVLKEANIGEDKGNDFWLGIEGLRRLRIKLEKELTYGPEIFNLKSITIADNNFIDSKNNGEYSPITNEINISVSRMMEAFPFSKQTQTLDMKVQMAYDVIFHEYGHHIANSYLTNVKPGAVTASKSIFRTNYDGGRVQSTWNKNFLDQFKTNLKYNSNTPLVGHEKIQVADKKTGWKTTDFESLGSVYNQKDLFDLANGQKKPSFVKLKEHKGFSGYVGAYKKAMYNITKEVDTTKLGYYFSLSELYTRKYQQLNMINHSNGKSPALGYDENGWIHTGDTAVHAFASELLMNRNMYESTNTRVGHEEVFRYLQDGPFVDTPSGIATGSKPNTIAHNLYNIMDKHMGHIDGSDISYIWGKNNSRRVGISSVKIDTKEIEGKIKFGGYVADKKYVSVGYWNSDKSHFTSFPITTRAHKYKKKDFLMNNMSIHLDSNLENNFYTTNDWINTTEIKDKQLFFSTVTSGYNNTNTIPLSSIRDSIDSGKATTWINAIETHGGYKAFGANIKDGPIVNKVAKKIVSIGDISWK